MLTVESFIESFINFIKVNLNVFYSCSGDSRIIHIHLQCEYEDVNFPDEEKLIKVVQFILKRLFPQMVIHDENYYEQMGKACTDPYEVEYNQPYGLYCLACKTLTAVSEDTEEVICRRCSPDGKQMEFW